MPYKPKIIAGRVRDTGYPIDGHVLTFSQWDYDNRESWHLYGWDEASDEAVMLTMFKAELEAATEICLANTGEPLEYSDEDFENFKKTWEAGEWEPDGVFCLPLDKVEVVTVLQEEEPNEPPTGYATFVAWIGERISEITKVPAEWLKGTRGQKGGKNEQK